MAVPYSTASHMRRVDLKYAGDRNQLDRNALICHLDCLYTLIATAMS